MLIEEWLDVYAVNVLNWCTFYVTTFLNSNKNEYSPYSYI